MNARVTGLPGESLETLAVTTVLPCRETPSSGSTVSAHFLFTSIFHAVMAARPSNVQPSSTTVASTAKHVARASQRLATELHTCRAGFPASLRSPWHPNHEDTVHATEFLTEAGERPPEGARLSPKCWGRPRRHGRP
jgi:hypothetical protein